MLECSVFNSPFFLSVEVESGSVLLLGFLTTDTTRRHPGALDASVIGSYHCYDGPTPDIPACTGVGLPPLYSEEGRQALQLGLRLCAQNDVEIYVKQGMRLWRVSRHFFFVRVFSF